MQTSVRSTSAYERPSLAGADLHQHHNHQHQYFECVVYGEPEVEVESTASSSLCNQRQAHRPGCGGDVESGQLQEASAESEGPQESLGRLVEDPQVFKVSYQERYIDHPTRASAMCVNSRDHFDTPHANTGAIVYEASNFKADQNQYGSVEGTTQVSEVSCGQQHALMSDSEIQRHDYNQVIYGNHPEAPRAPVYYELAVNNNCSQLAEEQIQTGATYVQQVDNDHHQRDNRMIELQEVYHQQVHQQYQHHYGTYLPSEPSAPSYVHANNQTYDTNHVVADSLVNNPPQVYSPSYVYQQSAKPFNEAESLNQVCYHSLNHQPLPTYDQYHSGTENSLSKAQLSEYQTDQQSFQLVACSQAPVHNRHLLSTDTSDNNCARNSLSATCTSPLRSTSSSFSTNATTTCASSTTSSSASTLSDGESIDSTLPRDEKKAKEANIPLSYNEIVNLSIDQFNEHITRFHFTEAQLTLMKDIRRRGKNKVAAQTCRKRKMEQIIELQHEVGHLVERRISLSCERNQLTQEHCRLSKKHERLYALIQSFMMRQQHHQQQQQVPLVVHMAQAERPAQIEFGV